MECVYLRVAPLNPTPPDSWEQSTTPTGIKNNQMLPTNKPSQGYSLSDYIMPTTPETRSDLAVLESLNYFNTSLVREVAPAHPPFQRTLIEASQWLAAPKAIQQSLVLLTTSCQKSRTTLVPSLDKDLCQVRASCLNELRSLMSDVKHERYAMAFDCIQLMMLAEMQLEPTGPWSYHLEATRRLIQLQGGPTTLFHKTPAIQGMLINFMEIDIMTSTTCPVGLLNPEAISAQNEYIPLLSHSEEDTITTPCFSPIPLLQAIVDINNLRIRLSQPANSPTELSSRAAQHYRIASAISTFNPSTWATRILTYATPLPLPPPNETCLKNHTAMTTLAQTHQNAATLYLHLSCPLPQTPNVSFPHANLTQNLSTLLAQASAHTESPVYTQLHKFSIWPLLVAAYAHAGWGLGSAEDISRVGFVAALIDSRPLRVAAGVMQGLLRQRGVGEGRWEWDEGWGGARGSFCVL